MLIFTPVTRFFHLHTTSTENYIKMSTPELNLENLVEDLDTYLTHAQTVLENWNLDVFGNNPDLVWFQNPRTGGIPLSILTELADISNTYPGCGIAVVNALIEEFKKYVEVEDESSGDEEEEAVAGAEVSEGAVDASDVPDKASENEVGVDLEDQEHEPKKILEGKLKEAESEVIEEVTSENVLRVVQRLQEENRALRQRVEHLESQL